MIGILNYKRQQINIQFNNEGEHFDKTVLVREFFIGNISAYGGFVDTFFISSVTDGFLDIGISQSKSREVLITTIFHYLRYGSGFAKLADIYKAREIVFLTNPKTKIQIDFEKSDFSGEIRVECVQNALNMLVPNQTVL